MDHLASATGPPVRPFMSENPKRNALIATGALGGAALLVAAYAATTIFVPAIRGSLSQTGAIVLTATTGATALVIGGGLLTVYILKSKQKQTSVSEPATMQTSIDWTAIEALSINSSYVTNPDTHFSRDGRAYVPDFEPRQINDRMYGFYGFKAFSESDSQYYQDNKLAKEEYVKSIKTYPVVINLLHAVEEQQHLYMTSAEFIAAYTQRSTLSPGVEKYTNPTNQHHLYHISAWEDDDQLTVDYATILYRNACQIVDAAPHQPIFVHCYRGFARTSAFVVLCELATHRDKLKGMNNDQIRGFIVMTLKQIHHTDAERRPRTAVLQNVLLNDEFINQTRTIN